MMLLLWLFYCGSYSYVYIHAEIFVLFGSGHVTYFSCKKLPQSFVFKLVLSWKNQTLCLFALATTFLKATMLFFRFSYCLLLDACWWGKRWTKRTWRVAWRLSLSLSLSLSSEVCNCKCFFPFLLLITSILIQYNL